MSTETIIGVVCVGALRNQKVNEVAIVKDGYFDGETGIWWSNGTALVTPGGSVREARENSCSFSVHGENGNQILPLTAEWAYSDKYSVS